MPTFNLQAICQELEQHPTVVRSWLILSLRTQNFENSLELSESEIEKILVEINRGLNRKFDLAFIEEPEKAYEFSIFLIRKSQKVIPTPNIKFNLRIHKLQLSEYDIELEKIESNIKLLAGRKNNDKNTLNRLNLVKSKIQFARNAKEEQMKTLEVQIQLEKRAIFNSKFYKQLNENLVSKFPYLQTVNPNNKDIYEAIPKQNRSTKTNSSILKAHYNSGLYSSLNEDSANKSRSDTQKSLTAIISWENVTFGDGFLFVKNNGKYLDKIPFKKSKLSFNALKQLYRHRKLEPLKIEYLNNKVIRIINLDLLDFLFLFFEHSGTRFEKRDLSQIIGASDYNKSFYKKYLSDFFTHKCFALLIKICDNQLPIIPLPERVINSSGIETVHESFLFPLNKRECYYWVWESIEEKKATFVFQTSKSNYVEEIQVIYDFINGEFENKRSALIRRLLISQDIRLIKRFKHTDFIKWKAGIESLIKTDFPS